MKLSEIRGKDSRQLTLDLQALRKEFFGLKFKASAEEVSDTARFRQIRRTAARIHTVLGERQRAEVAAGTETTKGAVSAGGTES